MMALAQELIGLQGPWMSTGRNEKISNHEKDMFRDNLPTGELDRTSSVSGAENMLISASPWFGCPCQQWRDVWSWSPGLRWVGRRRLWLSLRGVALCASASCSRRVLNLERCSKQIHKVKHFLGKYLLANADFQKSGLGLHSLVHTRVPVVNEGSISCTLGSLSIRASPLLSFPLPAGPLYQPASIPSSTASVPISPCVPDDWHLKTCLRVPFSRRELL